MSTRDLEWHHGTHGWEEHDGYPRHQHSLNGVLTIVPDDPHLHFKRVPFTTPASKATQAPEKPRASLTDDIAGLLHADACYTAPHCNRYARRRGDHYHYYQLQAAELVDQLEPLIGSANIEPVILAVLDVLS